MKKSLFILGMAFCLNINAQIITTVVGNGTRAYGGDGAQATASELSYPSGVTFDAVGNLYIADWSNNCIRKVSSSGIISTVAGNGSLGNGFSGDGGSATAALLYQPNAIAFDVIGNMYIADYGNNRIRMVNT